MNTLFKRINKKASKHALKEDEISQYLEIRNKDSAAGTILSTLKYTTLLNISIGVITKHITTLAKSSKWEDLPIHLLDLIYQELLVQYPPSILTHEILSYFLLPDSSTRINISGSNLSSSFFDDLGKNKWDILTELFMNEVQVSDKKISNAIKDMPLLKKFSNRGNLSLSDIGVEAISKACTLLEYVNISHTKVKANGISKILENCKFIKTLKLASILVSSNNSWKEIFTGAPNTGDKRKIDAKNQVETRSFLNLKFRHTCIGTAIETVLQQSCWTLKTIDVMHTKVRNLTPFFYLENLVKCNLSDIELSSSTQLSQLLVKLLSPTSKLTTLLLGHLNVLNDSFFTTEMSSLMSLKLTRLSLFENKQLKNLPNLISSLFLESSSLSFLDLSNCNISCKSFNNQNRKSTRLTTLNLLNSLSIDDSICEFIVGYFPKLKSLDLSGTRCGIDGIKRVLFELDLKWINTDGCREIPILQRRTLVQDLIKEKVQRV